MAMECHFSGLLEARVREYVYVYVCVYHIYILISYLFVLLWQPEEANTSVLLQVVYFSR